VSVCVAAEQSKECSSSINVNDESLIEAIVRTYNSGLVFGPSEDRMAYTIRDPLTSGTLLLLLPVLELRGNAGHSPSSGRPGGETLIVNSVV